MNIKSLRYITLFATGLFACNISENKNTANHFMEKFEKGTFGYDLMFLRDKDSSMVVLQSNDSASKVIVSPKYQAKVFTSTSGGDAGKSFGWVNYKAFDGPVDAHMNAYGGEDRLWLGPEGGKYSLFFKPGSKMVFDEWHTPPAIDTEAWIKETQTQQSVQMSKTAALMNYTGATLEIRLERLIEILPKINVEQALGITIKDGVSQVGFKTVNTIVNIGKDKWNEKTGMPCLWSLDMFNPSEQCIIVIPYEEKASGKIATTDYFGEIAKDRIKMKDGILYFKADGKSRGKLGLPPGRAKNVAGSYDATASVLTLIKYDVTPTGKYLNQEWNTEKPVFSGDVMNAYNDGPLEDGKQMGPFYELESVSPAASLEPGQKLTHHHSVFHFEGDKASLNEISVKVLGVSLQEIESSLKL